MKPGLGHETRTKVLDTGHEAIWSIWSLVLVSGLGRSSSCWEDTGVKLRIVRNLSIYLFTPQLVKNK